MSAPSCFLVAGGTGRQGGAVVDALLTDKASPVAPERIYVITREGNGTGATKLVARGIQLILGHLGQPAVIFDHLRAQGVPMNQTAAFLAQAHGSTELSDARAFIDAAVEAGLRHIVYSSVDRGGKELSDRDPSWCKTFANKFHIEKHLIAATSAARAKVDGGKGTVYTIIRPTWFANNALWGFPGKLCMTGWRENMYGKRMQVTVTKDIGRWAVQAMVRPDDAALRDTAVSIASECLSFQEVDEIFLQETGQPVGVTWGWLARLAILMITDLRTMFSFINERDYGADMETLAKTLPPTTFREWVKEASQS
jgi:uncharacterized protein YbjT (DUF2867 family)